MCLVPAGYRDPGHVLRPSGWSVASPSPLRGGLHIQYGGFAKSQQVKLPHLSLLSYVALFVA